MKKLLPLFILLAFFTIGISYEDDPIPTITQEPISESQIDRLVEIRDRACSTIAEGADKDLMQRIAMTAIHFYVPAFERRQLCSDRFDRLIVLFRNANEKR